MKRFATILSLLLIVCLMTVALTACGEAPEIKIGENGNWFIDGVDTEVKAQGTNGTNGTNGADGANGTNGSVVSIGENGNWFIDGVDTGVVAVPEKYVVDVKTETGIDLENGKQYVDTTLIYNDGTSKTERAYIPARVTYLSISTANQYYAGYAPMLQLNIQYEDYSYETVIITEDMYASELPDFTTAGIYDIEVEYAGQTASATINVVEATDIVVSNAYLDNYAIRKGTPVAEVGLYVSFTDADESDRGGYVVSLADCSALSVTDFNTVIDMQKLNYTYKDYSDYTYISVYDPEICNIQGIYINGYYTLALGADADAVQALLDEIVGLQAEVYFYEPVDGESYTTVTITADMLDASELDTSKIGYSYIKLTVTVDGQGSYTEDIYVAIEADMTTATLIGTYAAGNPMLTSMFGDVELYDNSVALLDGTTQMAYTLEGTMLTLSVGEETYYFTVDDDADTYTTYVPTSGTAAIYTSAEDNMKVEVYTDYLVINYYMPASGSTPEMSMPVFTTTTSIIEDNSFELMGSTITLNSDGTLTMN